MRWLPATLLAALAGVTLAGCGSGPERVIVTATGRIGPLHVDESDRAGVISFAGPPESERQGRYLASFHPFDALGYQCAGKAATSNTGIPQCKTVFYLDSPSGKLALLYTEDARYLDPHGVHAGTRTPVAEHRLHKHAFNGCYSGFRFDTGKAFLVMWLDGGTKRVGDHVGFLVVHSRRLNPGVLDCIDS